MHRLTSYPRVINVVGARGTSSMVNLLERSIPSFSVSFPLYKPASLPLIFYFQRQIHDQNATITFDELAYRLPGVPIIYTSPVAHLQPVSIFQLLLNSLVSF